MASVVALLVTPVKSLRIHQADSVRVERWGAVGNRVFYLAEQDGRLLNGSKGRPLHRLVADWDAEADHLSIAFPNGLVAEGSGDADGRPITTSFYGRRVSAKAVGGPFAQALSDYVGRPVLLARPDREGDANDDAPVSVCSRASAEELARQSGRPEALDVRRFRMLVVVDGSEPHEEDAWRGREICLGEALVEVDGLCARCVVTTLDPEEGTKDLDTLRVLRGYRPITAKDGVTFGVYARVIEPGTIRVGDPVEVVG
jgi:uncharacterized protein